MEITAQITALEEELKILKGEVKSILEEIRTALLDRDNPFGAEGGLPVFQPVQRPGLTEEPAEPGQEGNPGPPPATADGPTAPPGPMPPPPTADGPTAPPSPMPGPPPGGPPVPPGPPVTESAASQPAAPNPGAAEVMDEAGPQPWSVHTIASLVAWIDETTSRLDATHLHMILDLTRFGGLIPLEAEEVLLKVIKLASSRKDKDGASPSVNDILLALRQLEAIMEGEESDELSPVRRRRTAGRNR